MCLRSRERSPYTLCSSPCSLGGGTYVHVLSCSMFSCGILASFPGHVGGLGTRLVVYQLGSNMHDVVHASQPRSVSHCRSLSVADTERDQHCGTEWNWPVRLSSCTDILNSVGEMFIQRSLVPRPPRPAFEACSTKAGHGGHSGQGMRLHCIHTT